MTSLDSVHPMAALIGLLVGAAAGWWCPVLIAALPEPEPDPEPAPDEPVGRFQRAAQRDKILYRDLAGTPGLASRLAVASAAVGAVVAGRLGGDWSLLVALPLVPVGVVLTYIDWRTTYLPTRIIAPTYGILVATILVAALVEPDRGALVGAAVGWAVYGGFFFLLWFILPGGLGYGDVRLSGVLGLALGYLGWSELYIGMMAGVLLGGLGGPVLALLRLTDRKRFPYGPFMLVGALLGILFGHAVTDALGYGAFSG